MIREDLLKGHKALSAPGCEYDLIGCCIYSYTMAGSDPMLYDFTISDILIQGRHDEDVDDCEGFPLSDFELLYITSMYVEWMHDRYDIVVYRDDSSNLTIDNKDKKTKDHYNRYRDIRRESWQSFSDCPLNDWMIRRDLC